MKLAPVLEYRICVAGRQVDVGFCLLHFRVALDETGKDHVVLWEASVFSFMTKDKVGGQSGGNKIAVSA